MFESVQRFRSKVDGWLVSVAVLSFSISLFAAWASGSGGLAGAAVLVPVAGLVLWVFTGTIYVLDDQALRIRCAFFRWSIPLTAIRALRAARDGHSAPALSLDRIAVEHTSGTILISPREKALFVAAVQARVPAVRIDGLEGVESLASSDWQAERRQAFGIIKMVAGVQLLAFTVLGVSLYFGTRPPTVTMSPDRVSVQGSWASAEISRDDIVAISLEQAMPKVIRKSVGFDGFGSLRGAFRLDGIGQGRLFVERGKPPYVLVRTSDSFTYVNFDDPARTRALYAELLTYWQDRRRAVR
jgi:hypothetical protein